MSVQPATAGHYWNGPIAEKDDPRWKDPDYGISRMEYAHSKVCGWCGGQYEAWMDLDEWVCFSCAMHPERLP